MKFYLTFLFACVFLVSPVYAISAYKELNFTAKSKDERLDKFLWGYSLAERNVPLDVIKAYLKCANQAKAFKVDLNDDGIEEIIGIVYSTAYWGTAGYSLFILDKANKKNSYENIAFFINIEPQEKFYILNSKTNGYRDILFHGSVANNFEAFIARYADGKYYNDVQLKNFIDALKQ